MANVYWELAAERGLCPTRHRWWRYKRICLRPTSSPNETLLGRRTGPHPRHWQWSISLRQPKTQPTTYHTDLDRIGSIHGSDRVGSGWVPIVWVTLGDTSVTLDAVGKFTFSEVQVLLKFDFRCTLKLELQLTQKTITHLNNKLFVIRSLFKDIY